MTTKVIFYLLAVFSLKLLYTQCENPIKPIVFINNGYEQITIAIRNNVVENPRILENLKETLTKASQTLWTATQNRAYFRQFNIIVPQHWSDQPSYTYISDYCVDNADIRIDTNVEPDQEPYTIQLGGCGEPGKVINIPLNFILDQQLNKDKEVVKQWAHYRYGVFNEHGIRGDANWPSFTLSQDGTPIPNICKKISKYIIDGPGDKCQLNLLTQKIDPLCTIVPLENMGSSLMFKPFTDEMQRFCSDDSNDLDHNHNSGTFTQQNVMCGDRSVSDVIFSHQDFQIRNTSDGRLTENKYSKELNAESIKPTKMRHRYRESDNCYCECETPTPPIEDTPETSSTTEKPEIISDPTDWFSTDFSTAETESYSSTPGLDSTPGDSPNPGPITSSTSGPGPTTTTITTSTTPASTTTFPAETETESYSSTPGLGSTPGASPGPGPITSSTPGPGPITGSTPIDYPGPTTTASTTSTTPASPTSTPQPPPPPPPPTFNIYKQDNSVSKNQVFVLLFDVSGSMSGTRIEVISLAAQLFLERLAPNGLRLGIAQFHTYATTLHPIVEIDAQTRQSLIDAVPTQVLGATSIGAGLLAAMAMIAQSPWNTTATIVLMSDGEENTLPYIESPGVADEIIRRGIQVNTFAIGNEASSLLERLAIWTGGIGLFFSLNGVVDKVALANEMAGRFITLASDKCEEDPQSVLVANKIFTLSAQQTVYYVAIDSQLGLNTVLIVASQYISNLVVTFKSPDNLNYDNSSAEYKVSDNSVSLTIADSKPGKWAIAIEKITTISYSVAIQVVSEIRNLSNETTDYPVRLNANLSNTVVDPNNPPKIFAELKKGNLPVLLATVTGVVETPNGNELHVILTDNGVGADAVRNDGIYSAYFTNYTVEGRYNVLVEAVNNGEARLRRRSNCRKPLTNKTILNNNYDQLLIDNFTQVLYFSNTESELTPVDDFSRVLNAGAFRLDGTQIGDRIAPSVVSDLTLGLVNEYQRTIDIQWTSAGNDMTSGLAKQVILRAAYNLKDILNEQIFDTLYQFNDSQVVQGSLSPLNGGLQHFISLSVNDLWENNGVFSLFIALKTVDYSNNFSPISNPILVNFGVLTKVTILYSWQYTLFENILYQQYDLSIENNSTTSGSILILKSESLSSLDIIYRTPRIPIEYITTGDNRLTTDELNGIVVLNYDRDYNGVWSLFLRRVNVINPIDIHFSVQLIQP